MISFITCLNNWQTYNKNVLKSINENIDPFYKNYELIPIDNTKNKYSASQALNLGAKKSKGSILVFCHQDIYFYKNWIKKLQNQIRLLPNNWGIAGCAGATLINGNRRWVSHMKDRRWRGSPHKLPRKVQTLDELILIIKAENFKNPLQFDENIPGFHFYGADICLQALDNNLINYVIDAPVLHKSGGINKINESFWNNLKYIKSKWSKKFQIIVTTCIDEKMGKTFTAHIKK